MGNGEEGEKREEKTPSVTLRVPPPPEARGRRVVIGLGIEGLAFFLGLIGVGWIVELVAFEHGAEVGVADHLGVDEFFGGAFGEDFARVEDVGAVADAEGLLDIVIGDEDRDASLGEEADLGLEVFDGDGVYATEWFVEEDEFGVGDECACDFEFSAFASGACAGGVVGFVGQREAFEEFGGFGFACSAVEGEGFEDGEQVLFAGEALEDGGFLGEVSDAELGVAIHGEPGDFGVVEDDAPGVSFDHADGHAEGCCFSCAVAAQEPDDLGVFDIEGDAIDDGSFVVGFFEVDRFEQGHGEE